MKRFPGGLVGRLSSAAVAAALLLPLAGCGTSSAPAASAQNCTGVQPIRIDWLFTGPQQDGGFNQSQETGMVAQQNALGCKVDVHGTFDVVYDQSAGQLTKQLIAQGSKMIIDTLGLANIFTDVCAAAPQVACLELSEYTPLPSNVQSYWAADWNLNYVAGVAAGLSTKTNKLGFIAPYKIPIVVQGVNAFEMGCLSVNPQCKTNLVYTNNYFDPIAGDQAANTLLNTGVDVLRGWIDDAGWCVVAQQHNAWALPAFYDQSKSCPKAILTSTVWTFDKYVTDAAKAVVDGTFKGGGFDVVKLCSCNDALHLGAWGPKAPADVKSKTLKVWNDLVGGKNVFVGPISDNTGTVKVQSGQSLADDFLAGQWDWYVQGVSASS